MISGQNPAVSDSTTALGAGAKRAERMRYVLGVVCGFAVVVLLLVAGPWICLGSPDSLIRIAQGRPVMTDVSLVSSTTDDLKYRLMVKNVGLGPVQILGVTVQCDCMAVDPQPRLLRSGAVEFWDILVDGPKKSVTTRRFVQVLTDVPSQPRIQVEIEE